MREDKVFRHSSILLLTGISLAGFVFFSPDAAGQPGAGFIFKIATSSSWSQMYEPAAAWCSFKIVLLSLGLFLVIESLGTILAVVKRKKLAWLVYSLHVVPCFGVVAGSYYMVKALL